MHRQRHPLVATPHTRVAVLRQAAVRGFGRRSAVRFERRQVQPWASRLDSTSRTDDALHACRRREAGAAWPVAPDGAPRCARASALSLCPRGDQCKFPLAASRPAGADQPALGPIGTARLRPPGIGRRLVARPQHRRTSSDLHIRPDPRPEASVRRPSRRRLISRRRSRSSWS